MNPQVRRVLLAVFLIIPAMVFSQEKKSIEILQLSDQLYKLTYNVGYTVNMVASVGEDGILLVDTGEKAKAEELKKAVASFEKGIPKIIINTHAHVDHTGGNAIFGDDPIVIAHDILRTRLRSGSYLFDEFPDATLPDITFRDSLTLYVNGETIKLYAFPGSHDDNDIIVWFTKARIAYIGDITNGVNFPSVEEITGNVLKFPEVSLKVMEYLPEDITLISGHGEDGGRAQLKEFSEGIEKTIEIIRAAVAVGKDEKTMQEEDILKDWESFEGSYVSREEWLNLVYMALTDSLPKKVIYEPMYYAIRDKGAKAAIGLYYELKKNHSDEYRFVENDLLFMADKLYKNGKYGDAIAFLELDINEYPDGIYTYYNYFLLGNIYKEMGNQKLAIENYRNSYELKQTETVAKILEEFEKD